MNHIDDSLRPVHIHVALIIFINVDDHNAETRLQLLDLAIRRRRIMLHSSILRHLLDVPLYLTGNLTNSKHDIDPKISKQPEHKERNRSIASGL